MRKIFLTALLLCLIASAQASVQLPAGESAEFAAFTGILAKPAVVLCESLSVCDERNGQVISALSYGDVFMTSEGWDGWANCYFADGSVTGWVKSDSIAADPAWYIVDEAMQVYAYPDRTAPRVALLESGTRLPILHEEHDWFVVSLRGASGWIRKTAEDHARFQSFRPEQLAHLAEAELDGCVIRDPKRLKRLSELLIHADPIGERMAGCPFTSQLNLKLADGSALSLEIASDSCCVYRVNNWDYQYARHLCSGDEHPDNSVLFQLFSK